ncbi:MAG: hypothetical protein KDC53_20810, partial [Saprospiraceae bacterium]|nr:hypothetical protein [Saprospiraceae bacterium]
DAAYAGTALLLPEQRWMSEGMELADSFVFNPHKWLFTNFDCTAYFVQRADLLIRTFEILPEYLKTKSRGQVNDYRDWGIQLGRRFRALKLWLVLRSYGLQGVREKMRNQIKLSQKLVAWIINHQHLELMSTPILNFCSFRINPSGKEMSQSQLNDLNEEFLHIINSGGEVFLSHTKVEDKFVIRVVMGQTYFAEKDLKKLIKVLSTQMDRTLGGR